jgi:uncharacterized protein
VISCRTTMTERIERKLREIVDTSTRKAAIEEWKTAAEKQRAPLYNYRFDHVEEVVSLSKEIALNTDANLEVVILAAWLHDLAKPGIGGISAEQHGIASAELAKDILTAERVDPEVIEQVADVIRKHVGLKIEQQLEPLEAQILWEADKLLKLGMIGLIQSLLNTVRLFPGRNMIQIADSIRKFLSLASEIAACMHTKRGKEIANERLNTLRELSKRLDKELDIGE